MADVIERANVRMIQAGDGSCFTLESLSNFRSLCEPLPENLDRDGAVQPRIPCPIHFAHAARAQQRLNFIGPEFYSGVEGHWCEPL